MTKRLLVVPAYGRDYKSKSAIEADLVADKDFRISDMSAGRDDGRYVNLSQLVEGQYDEVTVCYKKLAQVAVFKIDLLAKRAELPAKDASPSRDEGDGG